jgi:hypothetical protein
MTTHLKITHVDAFSDRLSFAETATLIRTESELDDHPLAPPASSLPLPLRRPPPARPREPRLAPQGRRRREVPPPCLIANCLGACQKRTDARRARQGLGEGLARQLDLPRIYVAITAWAAWSRMPSCAATRRRRAASCCWISPSRACRPRSPRGSARLGSRLPRPPDRVGKPGPVRLMRRRRLKLRQLSVRRR